MSDHALLRFLKLRADGLRVGARRGRGAAGELTRRAPLTVVGPEIARPLSFRGVVLAARVRAGISTAPVRRRRRDARVNRRVAAAAEERRIFVNAVDDAERASAYMGGVFRRGGVTIAVSTEGRAPALAGLLREGLEAAVPEDVEAWVDVARRLRQEQRATGVPMADRRPRLLRALNRLYAERGVEVEAGA